MRMILSILLIMMLGSFYSQLKRKDISSIYLINLQTNDTIKQEDRWIDSLTTGKLQSMIDYINSGNIYYVKTTIRKGEHFMAYQLTEKDFKRKKTGNKSV